MWSRKYNEVHPGMLTNWKDKYIVLNFNTSLFGLHVSTTALETGGSCQQETSGE